MIQVILAGFAMGLAGSFHCVGMCGPLALSLPLSNTNRWIRILSVFAYNTGRTITYFLMGALLGWTGSRFMLIGYQQVFSIAAGVVVLMFLIAGKYLPKIKLLSLFRERFKRYLSCFLKKENNVFSLFLFGVLNGLLPCGLVYMSVASALIIGNPLHSGIFMIAFGLGTLPLMALLMLTGHYLSFSVRLKLKKAVPYFIAGIAVLMILRGLNLGIPYISPAFGHAQAAMHCEPGH